MTATEWLTVIVCSALCLCAATLCITTHHRHELSAVAGSVGAVAGDMEVLRGEVVRLQMELDTLKHVRIDLTVVDKSTPVRVVEVEQ